MTNKEISTEVQENKEGPIVAIQYPATVKYTENEHSANELAKKYERFKALSPDDKEGYKELVLAIADVRTKRTDVAKQEKVIKDPLNRFRDIVIKTSKTVRGLLAKTEDDLKVTKQRIDDIHEERKLAMQKLWQDNLISVRNMTEGLPTMGRIALNMLLDDLNNFDFESLDFGEYIEQAKATVELQINAVNERIEFLKEQQRLEEERQAFEKKQAERAAIEAENRKLRDQIAAMEKEKEPEQEPEIIGADIASWPDETVIVNVESNDGVTSVRMAPVSGRAAAIEQEPESTVVREDPKQEEDEHHGNIDSQILQIWANEIDKARGSLSGFVLTDKAKLAVKEVSSQLEAITSHLDDVAESLR